MVIKIKRRVIKYSGNNYGVLCPTDWNGYKVTILIKPKGLWNGIKYRRFKHKGKFHRAMNVDNADRYMKRLIWLESHVGAVGMKCPPEQLARVPEKYKGMIVEVSIKVHGPCKKCGC